MSNMKSNFKYFEPLRSVWAILLGACAGAYIGLFKQEYVGYVEPFGKMYLDILKMCILPILVSAISLSIGRLVNNHGDAKYLKKMIFVFFVSALLASIIGMIAGVIGQPGKNLDNDSMSALGSIIQNSGDPDLEVSLFDSYEGSESNSLLQNFFYNMVPDNIFNALSSGNNLKVLFFALLFGVALGTLKKNISDNILSMLEGVYATFARIVQWLMYLLPFGLCGLVALNLSLVGYSVLVAMMKFVPIAIATFAVLFIISALVMWSRTGSFLKPLQALKEPMLIALGTSNGLACLPVSLTAMHKSLGYEKQIVDLLIPLTFTLCRIGPTIYFALATMFVVQLYHIELGIEGLAMVVLGSILAGMATAGSSGIALLTMLGLVLEPLGLPLDAVIILFIVIDPIIAPFRVLAIVHTACAITTVILPKHCSEPTSEGTKEGSESLP